MAEIINFPVKTTTGAGNIPSSFVDDIEYEAMHVKTKYEYLQFTKKILDDEDYILVLAGIMDKEIYDDLEEDLQNVVDAYFIFDF